MANNTIGDFKSGFNGGSRANRFAVDIKWPNAVSNAPTNTIYHIIAAKLPEAELGSISVPYRGRVAHYAGDRDYKPWTVTVLDDISANASWGAFHAWSNLLSSHINNVPQDQTYSSGTNATLSNLIFKQLKDPSFGESATASNVTSQSVREIQLYNCWPSEVGQIGLDMGEAGNLVAFSVTFTYDYYKIIKNTEGY